jgi:hypothetical protein
VFNLKTVHPIGGCAAACVKAGSHSPDTTSMHVADSKLLNPNSGPAADADEAASSPETTRAAATAARRQMPTENDLILHLP